MTVPLVPRVRGLRRASWPRRARGNLHGLDVVARGTGRHVLSDGGWRRNGSRPVIPPQDESKQMRELVSRCLRGPRSGADVGREVLAGEGGAGGDDVGGGALEDDPAAVVAGAGAEVEDPVGVRPVSYTHLRAHETRHD